MPATTKTVFATPLPPCKMFHQKQQVNPTPTPPDPLPTPNENTYIEKTNDFLVRKIAKRNNDIFCGDRIPFLFASQPFFLGRPRFGSSTQDVKNYQGPTTSRENAILKHLNFHWNFVWGTKHN